MGIRKKKYRPKEEVIIQAVNYNGKNGQEIIEWILEKQPETAFSNEGGTLFFEADGLRHEVALGSKFFELFGTFHIMAPWYFRDFFELKPPAYTLADSEAQLG